MVRLSVQWFVRPFSSTPSSQWSVRSVVFPLVPVVRPFVQWSVLSSSRPSVQWSVRPVVRSSLQWFVRSSSGIPFSQWSVQCSVGPFPVVHLFVQRSLRPTSDPYVRPSSGPFVRTVVRPSVRPSVRPVVRLSSDPSIRLPSCPSVKSGFIGRHLMY